MNHLTSFECIGTRVRRSGYRALTAKRLEPGTIVELGIVLDELAIVTDNKLVDTNNGKGSRLDNPSPSDSVAGIPYVQGLNFDFGL